MKLRNFSFILIALVVFAANAAAQSRPAVNPVMIENSLEGTETWQIPLDGSSNTLLAGERIEGYASRTSVNVGETIKFFVNVVPTQNVTIHIYRLGYYDGKGARLIHTIENKPVTDKTLPVPDGQYGLAECNWISDAGLIWSVPQTAVSGVYLAKITGHAQSKQSYMSFVVRDDARYSKILFQRSVLTDQAYNSYPGRIYTPDSHSGNGKSLYQAYSYGPPLPGSSTDPQQARKVSFNRPYNRDDPAKPYQTAGGTLFAYDYQMIRWLEKNGYDVTYCTNIDTHTANAANGRLSADKHAAFLSVGHDEYWTWEMRTNIENARNRAASPLNLGFFTGNGIYWQVRLEDSLLPNQTAEDKANRVVVGYKDHAFDPENPDPHTSVPDPTKDTITRKWRQNVIKPDEDELMGVMWSENPPFYYSSNPAVIAADCPVWIKEGLIGQTMPDLIGFEADKIHDESVYANTRNLQTVGKSPYFVPNQTGHFSHMTFYTRYANQARVFAAGTLQWSWGLDNFHAYPGTPRVRRIDAETLTHNILRCLTWGICGTDEQY